MARSRVAVAGFLLTLVSLVGCQTSSSSSPPSTEGIDPQAIQHATDAYLAYERGDCETVEILARPVYLDAWQPNEVLYSMLLLNGFCHELNGDPGGAQTLYRELISKAPASFAAQDALERLRILKRLEQDSSYAGWVAGARDRANPDRENPDRKKRTPVERSPARFPPLPKTAGIEGYAVVEFGITPRGETEDPIVVDATPPLLFDGASIRAIRNWVFERTPVASGGTRDDDRQIIRIVFKRDSSASQSQPGEATP